MQKQILEDYFLTSDPIDFEHKKYLLLAYDQQFSRAFNQDKIYPYLTDIVDKLKYVNDFLRNIKLLESSAQEIEKIDWLKKEVIYQTKINDDSFDEVKNIAVFAKDTLADLYIRFKNLYDDVDSTICIAGSKVSIFNNYSGYMILRWGQREKIWEYEIRRVIYPEPTYILKTWRADLKEYYETRYQRNIFDIIINEAFPLKESLIPVIRRKFLQHILGYVYGISGI